VGERANTVPLQGKVVIELGAGCSGLPGLVAARDCGASHVVLTDKLPKLLKSLVQNAHLCGLRVTGDDSGDEGGSGGSGKGGGVRAAASVQSETPCEVSVQHLDWAAATSIVDESGASLDGKVDVILGSEVIWKGVDPKPLFATVTRLLKKPHVDSATGKKVEGGVALVLMPRGGRGAETQLLDEASTVGLSRETLTLPTSMGEEIGEMGHPTEECPSLSLNDDNWHLHMFRWKSS
jgi:hypothetical protein